VTGAVRQQPAPARAAGGGLPAQRAVIRWAVRLLRHEWRQQLLILALITVAVAAALVGAAVATNTPIPTGANFGSATDMATFPGGAAGLAGKIGALRHRFGRIDVIENETVAVPGSVDTYELRAQNSHGPFGQPMLSLVSGHYPAATGQVALTSGVASELRLTIGATWRAGGSARRVVGIVVNPQNLLDEFALVAPGQVRSPTQVTVLFDARGVSSRSAASAFAESLGATVVPRSAAASVAIINPNTISLAAITLGMLLIALVGVGGFTVLAQRRLRSIGMLGAQGATDASIRLVVYANGVATGAVGAVAGAVLGILLWLAYRPRLEASSHHAIGPFELPWLVIVVSMGLAVVAAYLAAARPARAIARVPIVAALAGRPPEPRQARRWAGPAGVALMVLAFFLIGFASENATSGGGSGSQSQLFLLLIVGLVALCAGVVLVGPTCLALLASAVRRGPVVVRLALRDLSRYRARSGAALGAISLSVLIAVIACVIAAGRFGNVLDYAGPNLASNQLVVYPALGTAQPVGPPTGTDHRKSAGSNPTGALPGRSVIRSNGTRATPAPVTAAQLATMARQAQGIAASLGSRDVVQLETTDSALHRAASGRNWSGTIYVATPQLLRAYGITAAQVSPDADILTMRPGLSSMTKMRIDYGAYKAGPPGPGSPCLPKSCLPSPAIQQVTALPSGTAAPNTVITEHAVHELGLTTSTAGWLIQAPAPLTAGEIRAAQLSAGAAGMAVATRDSIPTLTQIVDVATVFCILLALGILAMSVGLVRSETANQLRTLTATGASGTARRAIAGTTAGALALTGAVVGAVGGYVAAIGFFRTNQLDTLSALNSIPVATLLLIVVGMPLVASLGGWLLPGREPIALGRGPLG
jgi:putative ABC transport system permease protein